MTERQAAEQLLERFCRYVQIDTQANELANCYPSSAGQLELGRLLRQELQALGLTDAVQTERGIVYATIPATVSHHVPTIALFAHLDTSPETTGANVKPQVHRNYDGRDLVLPGDRSRVLRPSQNPDLAALIGKTIITTDGTTLLGADNKAGVAVIMQLAAYLMAHPEIPHGRIRICFTCDEEIGHGVDYVDLAELAAEVGYTFDGAGAGEIEAETFSADKAVVTIHGVNIHPSIGKGRMVNAVRLAGLLLARLPRLTLAPETTEGREGFIHPVSIEGGVAQTIVRLILRDFDTQQLAQHGQLLRNIAQLIESEYPPARLDVQITPQYRNMADGLAKEPRATAYAQEAMRQAGLTPRLLSLRGGTDGALLTAKGLPTPNLSTGEHNPHSPLEWTCLEEMEMAMRVAVELAKVWATRA